MEETKNKGVAMQKGICYIVGAGERPASLDVAKVGYWIAADGGYAVLQAAGIKPDLVLGDFDSLGYVPRHPNLIRTPAEKDDTDTMLAIKQGLELGFRRFVLYGCLGGRLDHSLANIQALTYLARLGCQGILAGRNENLTVVQNGQLRFLPGAKGYLSVFCLDGAAEGVDLVGLKYSLTNASMTNDLPMGVSNEFLGLPALVRVRRGTLAVIWSGSLFATLDHWAEDLNEDR